METLLELCNKLTQLKAKSKWLIRIVAVVIDYDYSGHQVSVFW